MLNVIQNIIGSLQGVSDRGSAPVASDVEYTGTLLQGQVLTGTYTYSDADDKAEGATYFAWYRADDTSGTNQVTIVGATSETYTLGSDDVDKHIAYAVTPVDINGYSGSVGVSSYQGAIVSNDTAPVASSVTYSGTLTQGQVLSGTYVYSDADGDAEGTSTYIWYRADDASGTNQAAIAGATSQTYTVASNDEAKFIAFQVIPVADNGYSGSAVRSDYKGMVNSTPVASSANYTGTLEEGEVIEGDYSWYNADGSADSGSTFIWYRADDASGTNQAAIVGATAQTYTLVAADLAKHIAFEVTPTSANGVTGVADVSAYKEAVASESTFDFTIDTNEFGASDFDQFKISVGTGTFLYDLTTSDGHNETGLTGDHTITFPSGSGIYSISISGQFPAFQFSNGKDKNKLITVDNFGIYGSGSTDQKTAFRGCDNLTLNATDSGNFGNVTNFEKFMFAANITGTSFPLIDTSSATRFDNAFRRTRIANFPANLFDNCNATNFSSAFEDTILSEQSIDNILVSLDAAGQSGGTFYQSGGSAPSSVGIAAETNLTNRGWTITRTS